MTLKVSLSSACYGRLYVAVPVSQHTQLEFHMLNPRDGSKCMRKQTLEQIEIISTVSRDICKLQVTKSRGVGSRQSSSQKFLPPQNEKLCSAFTITTRDKFKRSIILMMKHVTGANLLLYLARVSYSYCCYFQDSIGLFGKRVWIRVTKLHPSQSVALSTGLSFNITRNGKLNMIFHRVHFISKSDCELIKLCFDFRLP